MVAAEGRGSEEESVLEMRREQKREDEKVEGGTMHTATPSSSESTVGEVAAKGLQLEQLEKALETEKKTLPRVRFA